MTAVWWSFPTSSSTPGQSAAIASTWELARFARPDYVVDRAASAWDLERRSPWRAALVRLGNASLPNLGVTRPAPVVYSFYRIEWPAYDSLAASLTSP